MKKVFISYHHAEPDTTVANAVASTIRERGHDPFIDVDIEIGERWAQRIDDEIRRSSVFVVLLSESSIYRDMVRTEVQIAYELYMTGVQNSENDQALPFQILPVRVGYEGDLPYDLAGYLGALQYILWRHAARFPFPATDETDEPRCSFGRSSANFCWYCDLPFTRDGYCSYIWILTLFLFS